MTLELRNVTKVVSGKTHIKETSLTLETGHFNVLLGETGAGKTSLIKLMAGLDPMASGQIIINGNDVTKLSTQKRQISLVHQFFVNYPHMTVFDNIASPLRVAGMAKSEIQGRVEEAADILKLRPMLKRKPHELSGGQQQRVLLARAQPQAMGGGRVMLLDEPASHLDLRHAHVTMRRLRTLAAEGLAVLVVVHDLNLALRYADDVWLLDAGQLAGQGGWAEVLTPQVLAPVYGVELRYAQPPDEEPHARPMLCVGADP